MKTKKIPDTELVLNPDGSVYHLQLLNKHIADVVLLVGDQNRVKQISQHFSEIEFKIENREFITHTGFYKGKRITAISSGIGTDNVDIVMNELFAAVNINPLTREANATKRNLQIIRIGTSGALHPEIKVGSFVASSHGLGLDGLAFYYDVNFSSPEIELGVAFQEQINWPKKLATPYFVKGSEMLLKKIAFDMQHGITASGTGFYGPQGRSLTSAASVKVQEMFGEFLYENFKITNFDMETSALFCLGRVFGFECCTVNAIIANRASKTYSPNHKAVVDELIVTVLERWVAE